MVPRCHALPRGALHGLVQRSDGCGANDCVDSTQLRLSVLESLMQLGLERLVLLESYVECITLPRITLPWKGDARFGPRRGGSDGVRRDERLRRLSGRYAPP